MNQPRTLAATPFWVRLLDYHNNCRSNLKAKLTPAEAFAKYGPQIGGKYKTRGDLKKMALDSHEKAQAEAILPRLELEAMIDELYELLDRRHPLAEQPPVRSRTKAPRVRQENKQRG